MSETMEIIEKIKNIIQNEYIKKCYDKNEIKLIINEMSKKMVKDKKKANDKIIIKQNIKKIFFEYVYPINEADNLFHFVIDNKIYNKYVYSIKSSCSIIKRIDEQYKPFGSDWIHDIQKNDILDNIHLKRTEIFNKLRKIVLPEQCTPEWFKMREGRITASNLGTVLGLNKYEYPCDYIKKKITKEKFIDNFNCYNGKKFEEIASMIYQYRMNVYVENFGLIVHPNHEFIAASPDGICSPYKLDKIHLSKYVGRLIEIKCPVTRKICTTGPIMGGIVPIYYYCQIMQQLECCDLDECDFWQCSMYEYETRQQWLDDTNPNEPFRSKETDFEKGVLIQLIPKLKACDDYLETIYGSAGFIYPPSIEMNPYECDQWILLTLENIKETHPLYIFDKIIYWRLNHSHNVTVIRDKEWFYNNLDKAKKIHDYVTFLENNLDKNKLVIEFMEKRKNMERFKKINQKANDDILNYIENIITAELKIT